MKQIRFVAMLASVIAVSVTMLGAQAAKPSMSLGSVRIARSVTADGKPLPAGTYMLRVSDEMPKAVVGQSADGARWVEFLQGGAVKGREMATVLSKDELKAMGKGSVAPGTAKVQTLKGNDYIRVWVNHAGTQYLIHLGAK
jgi:hypothetical protein